MVRFPLCMPIFQSAISNIRSRKVLFQFREYRFKYFNLRLVLFISCLTLLGVKVIGSAINDGSDKKQLICFCAGLVVMLFLSIVDYHFILKFHWVIYVVNMGLLIYVKFKGDSGNGAQRWIRFGGSFGIQPSELAKICIILFFAWMLQKYQEKLNSPRVLFCVLFLFFMPCYLIYKQPDLSSSIVFLVIFCSIIFLAGLSYWYIGAAMAVGVPSLSFLIYKILQPGQTLISNYQKSRLLGFLYQNSSAEELAKHGLDINQINAINYQQKNSMLAIGSGQLLGKGLHNNTITSVKNGNFLAEQQTDFIYAIVGEELGFAGALAVIVLLFLISIECLWVARNAKDLSVKLIAGGMAAIIAFQSFVNLGVATWILPNTGLPLPFVSYGMSSLMSLMIGMGVVLNVSIQRELTFKEVLYTEY